MVSFALGITTRAFSQKSAAVGRASGSVSIARRTWASLSARTRFQSVPVLAPVVVKVLAAVLAKVLPIRFTLMSLRPPSRDDSPPHCSANAGYVRVDHRNLDVVYHAHGVNAHLAVIKALVHPLQRGPFENPDGIFKRN